MKKLKPTREQIRLGIIDFYNKMTDHSITADEHRELFLQSEQLKVQLMSLNDQQTFPFINHRP